MQDRSRAEDLSQEVFLRVHRGLPYFRGEARLSTWIYRIVANTLLGFLRRRGPITVNGCTQLQRAVEQLAPRERLVLELKQYFGLKLDTVASILGIEESAVRNIFVRATVALRLDVELQSIH